MALGAAGSLPAPVHGPGVREHPGTDDVQQRIQAPFPSLLDAAAAASQPAPAARGFVRAAPMQLQSPPVRLRALIAAAAAAAAAAASATATQTATPSPAATATATAAPTSPPLVVTAAGAGAQGYGGDGGPAASALLNNPTTLALLPNGDLVIVDSNNNRVRVLSGPRARSPRSWGRARAASAATAAPPRAPRLRTPLASR